MFNVFQEEYKRTLVLLLKEEEVVGTIHTYKIERLGSWKRSRTVSYDSSDLLVQCSCRKFEFEGILCSHILKLFCHLEFTSLPPQYYLKSKMLALEVELDAQIAMDEEAITKNLGKREFITCDKSLQASNEDVQLKDPPKKTRGPAKRIKDPIEIDKSKKKSTKQTCGRKEQSQITTEPDGGLHRLDIPVQERMIYPTEIQNQAMRIVSGMSSSMNQFVQGSLQNLGPISYKVNHQLVPQYRMSHQSNMTGHPGLYDTNALQYTGNQDAFIFPCNYSSNSHQGFVANIQTNQAATRRLEF